MGDHPALKTLEYCDIIELWRCNTKYGTRWYRESTHFYLGIAASNLGYDVVRLYCPGILWLLSTRVIAWAEDTAGRTVWADRVDAIGRGLVLQNAGSGATAAAGRLRDGVISGLAVESVAASGESISWVTGWGDLLEELQSLAASVNDDFSLDLVAADAQPFGWLFRWYTAQLGSDRSGTILFELELGTMSEPVYLLDQREEKTVCIVAGPELVGGKEYTVAVGDGYITGHNCR